MAVPGRACVLLSRVVGAGGAQARRSCCDAFRTTHITKRRPLSCCVIVAVVAYTYLARPLRADAAFAPHSSLNPRADSDGRDPSRPRYRISEVRSHGADSDRPWVTYGDKVYDITDWIPAHPGGEVILRAAGGSIDVFWDIFAIHKQPYVRDILETYLIGYVATEDLVDGKLPQDKIEDPFLQDPERHPSLLTLTQKPRNAETPGDDLAASFLTPNDLFYVRNHMWVPQIDGTGADHAVTIELPDGEIKSYTLQELREKFPAYKVTATLQCSGNRRKHMTNAGLKTNGLQWNVGGISSAEWEGVRLVDVLKDAGFPVEKHRDGGDTGAKHVWFSGLEAYGSSIPLDTVVDPRADVLLAYGMNGEPLPRDHGFPSARSPSQWQRRDYKLFGPNVGGAADWDSAPAIQEMPITSAITSIKVQNDGPVDCSDPDLPEKIATLQGYAFSGGGKRLGDDGESPCKGRKNWIWQRWRYDTQLPMDEQRGDKWCSTVVVKATDEVYSSQPEHHEGIYNLRGNLATAWHRVSVCTECRK
ncbi:unnamed protein product [Parascedosporium putredinis]|uniref:Nitrate reductase [NADPH] n=1 Tax=Parascedosporium putredinis TaxID=1442378 RepID=A0A9P1H247_9PEZI|nr:unnamed protein product [Parascedosporium putredinis]CAI7994276.1 unnamed protein product [Parascedosporium putredinis]